MMLKMLLSKCGISLPDKEKYESRYEYDNKRRQAVKKR